MHLAGAFGRVEPRGDDGYRTFAWSHDPRDLWSEGHAYRTWLADKGYDQSALREDPGSIDPSLHQTTWCANVAIDFLSEERDGPWLMSVNPFDPHPPLDPPQAYLDRYDLREVSPPPFRESDLEAQARLSSVDFQSTGKTPEELDAASAMAAYYAMIELVDHNVGRMLTALEATGQRDNTIVVFMSDHGELLGDHGLMHKGCRFYEGLVRLPLIVSWPERLCPDGPVRRTG